MLVIQLWPQVPRFIYPFLVQQGGTRTCPTSAFSDSNISGSHHQPQVPERKKPPETDAWSPVPSPEQALWGLGPLLGLDSKALQTALLCEHHPSTLASEGPRVTYYLPHCSCQPQTPIHRLMKPIHEPFLGPST